MELFGSRDSVWRDLHDGLSYNSLAQSTVAALYEYQCFQFKGSRKDAAKKVQLPHMSPLITTQNWMTNQTDDVHLHILLLNL